MNETQTVKVGETDKDVANVEAWAEIIADMLDLVPKAQRAEVLALAVKNEETAQKEQEKTGGVWFFEEFMDSPSTPSWNVTMRLKSLLVQVFVRDISNNHSPNNAARLLFAHHRHGAGSGDLQDYLDGMK